MPKKAALNKQEFDDIKNKLAEEKLSLEKQLNEIAKKNPKNSEDFDAQFVDIGSDESDSVAEVEKYSLDLSLERTLEKSLKDVNKALESIKKGTYGLCKYCKQPIDKDRLMARPTSTSCITCKTKLKAL
jgi:RNA polymerase-binding protein DksA